MDEMWGWQKPSFFFFFLYMSMEGSKFETFVILELWLLKPCSVKMSASWEGGEREKHFSLYGWLIKQDKVYYENFEDYLQSKKTKT